MPGGTARVARIVPSRKPPLQLGAVTRGVDRRALDSGACGSIRSDFVIGIDAQDALRRPALPRQRRDHRCLLTCHVDDVAGMATGRS